MKKSRGTGRLAILVGALSLIGSLTLPSAALAQEPAPAQSERCVLAGYTLKEGQDFREVVAAKDALEELGYQPREAGGSKTKFDKRMVKVVKEWEGHFGRDDDGEIDTGDWILLMSLAYGCRDLDGSDKSPFPSFGAVNDDYTRSMQRKLRDLCYPITVDGDFGNQTLNAVTAFQRARGHSDDGLVTFLLEEEIDQALQEGFCARTAPTTGQQPAEEDTQGGDNDETIESIGCDGRAVLQRGDNCHKVRDLQELLANFSCYARHQVDGDFGPGTLWSVTEFQKLNELGTERDGRVGPETLGALQRGPSSGTSCGAVDGETDGDCGPDEIHDFGAVFDHIACTLGIDDAEIRLPTTEREREVNNYFDVAKIITTDILVIAKDAAIAGGKKAAEKAADAGRKLEDWVF